MEARATAYVPYEKYMADEAVSEARHEWVDGQVSVMAAGTSAAVEGEPAASGRAPRRSTGPG